MQYFMLLQGSRLLLKLSILVFSFDFPFCLVEVFGVLL